MVPARWHRIGLMVFVAGAVLASATAPTLARAPSKEFAATLGVDERKAFEAWYSAQIFYSAALDAYWAKVDAKRNLRRRKRRAGHSFRHGDYVKTQPPVYDGPRISRALIKRWRTFRDQDKPSTVQKRTELPGVADYLAAARRHYGFSPERIPEPEYKRRYAREALRLGLTKDQVVRIFALETGGNGTADMQAGINPRTKRGRPISSALGYAQLLAANSINVFAKHGKTFVARLSRMVRQSRDPAERRRLQHKLDVLRKMVRVSKSIPYNWSRQRKLAKTSRGMGLHVMNIDGVIGPWMQVTKIADLKKLAARRGKPRLSGSQIELMNLAGPATGLEMMSRVGIDKPTPNFFSRRGYYRNTVVRQGQTSEGLLVKLEERMEQNLKKDGSKQFLAIFDELLRERRGLRRASQ